MNPAATPTLNGLLLPLEDRTLLLPSAAIAEVIHHKAVPEPVENAPDWLLGQIEWRGLKLPLLSFEVLSGAALPSPKRQIAILNVTHEQASLKFYALLLQGFPHTRLLDATLPRSDEPTAALELACVHLGNDKIGKIPNLPAVEEKLLQAGML